MTRAIQPQRRLGTLGSLMLGALTVAGLGGCFCHVKKEDPVKKEQLLLGQAVPIGCRKHCYLFFLHGCDPLDCINLSGMVERLQDLGYIKTYEGQFYHLSDLAKEIRKVHKEDPIGRFVLIGDGLGAVNASYVAGVVKTDNIPIDLLVYLNGGMKVGEHQPPKNVLEVINIQGKNSPGDNLVVNRAVNIIVPDVAEFGLATHPNTMEVVLRQLLIVAARVPIIEKKMPANPHQEPTPRPVKPAPEGPRDAWDFLKPESQSQLQKTATPRPAQPGPASPPPGGGPLPK